MSPKEPNLKALGWNKGFQRQITEADKPFQPARVFRQDASGYSLMGESGEMTGSLPGRTKKEAASRAQLPAVGDWVLVEAPKDSGQVTIRKLLERKSWLSRKAPGDRVDEQIIAANIDTVFLVSGLDEDFNSRRIERYLVLARASGASPVIVLNKADLAVAVEVEAKTDQINRTAANTPIRLVSALTGEGMEQLRAYLYEGQTLALIGSSGVGKSTIINYLLGYEKFPTGEVRADDSKGRHTTTFREMSLAPDGGLIVDTPGMREIQLWGDETLLSTSFGDIESLAGQCRFADCEHLSEPGCAVKAAIENGELDESRLKSFHKLQGEISALREQTDVKKQIERKAVLKKSAANNRQRMSKK